MVHQAAEHAGPGTVGYHAFGGIGVAAGDEALSVGGPTQRRLLAVLLVHRNTVVSVDRLCDILFAGEPTDAAPTTLRSYVARLRRVLERPGSATCLVTQPPGYRLDVADDAFDVACFEHGVEAGRKCLARGDPAEAAQSLRQGLARWRGDPYAEFADEDWARPEVQRLAELRLVAHEILADADLACGRAAEVVSELEALAAEHPVRGSFRSRLMVALYRSGREAEALRVYQEHRRALAEDLGLEPSPELAELERQILSHDETLAEPRLGEVPLRGYRLGERLGTGRDGTVHAARLPGVERDLVIRIVPEALANDPGLVRSFDADARRLAALRHEAVVPLYDWWREPGAAYLVMRRLRGGTLRDRLQRGPLPPDGVGTLVTRLGGALGAAAKAGIAHGRIIAESVLFDEAGEAYLGDFPVGTEGVCDPAGDARDLLALVAEALTGRRTADGAGADIPPVVADALTTVLSATEPLALADVVSMVVEALSGEAAVPPALDRPNPYKGLRAFDEPDADDFFGRDDLVDEIRDRLADRGPRGRLVLVVGGSGSGKSSLVRAGLLPRVRGPTRGSRGWFVAAMAPGASPFRELAEALRRVAVVEAGGLEAELAAGQKGIADAVHRIVPAGGEMLLVVDQLEELFTLADDATQRAFLDGLTAALCEPDGALRVVATLRADFYDRPLQFERFGALVGEATVPIPAMSAAELETAIVGPAERVGGRVEPVLAAELVGAVLHQPAALPSLQFTLFELAERSPERVLTLAAYRELGGVDAAIAARAEALYQALDDRARAGARRLFERLVVINPDGEPTRRPALRSELEHAAGGAGDGSTGEVLDVIEAWAQARLLTLDRHPQSREPTVEVAHEALLREWPRLRGWLEDDREAIVAVGQLREAATGWEGLDRDPGALYRGARLDTALQLVDGQARALAPIEREFLDASRTERDRQRQHEVDELQRTARANRRLRAQLVALAVALVVALVVGVVAVGQRNRASEQRSVARARELAAAADANRDVDPERSMLLALAAVDRSRSGAGAALPEAEQALHDAVTASRIEWRAPGVGGAVAWSPDGTRLAAAGADGTVTILDAESGEPVQSIAGHDERINGIAFSPDGTMLGTTSEDNFAKVWDLASGQAVYTFESPTGRDAIAPSFSPDGSLFAASWWNEGLVRVVDLATGTVVHEIQADYVVGTSFDPSGARIALASLGGSTVVVDAHSGDELLTVEGSSDAAWSPDGSSIAVGSDDGSARVVDATTGEQRAELLGHRDRLIAIDWSPDGSRVVTASNDGTAKVWRIAEGGGQELFTLSAQDTRNGVEGVAFSPDGTRIATGDGQNTAAIVWNASISGDAEIASFPALTDSEASEATFTPDGRYLLSPNEAGGVTAWDAETFDAARLLGTPAGPSAELPPSADYINPPTETVRHISALGVSPDGGLVAVAASELSDDQAGSVEVWDVTTGREAFHIDPRGYVDDVAWSPDGEHLAISATQTVAAPEGGVPYAGNVTIVDRSGRQVAVLPDEEGGVQALAIAFSPDGRRLIGSRSPMATFAPRSARLVVWDWRDERVERTIETAGNEAVLSPTEDIVVSTTYEFRTQSRLVEVWDWSTGQHLRTLSGHTGAVSGAAFSPDGSRLATASADGTVRVWDPRTGEQQLVLRGHVGPVNSVAFSPDGERLASVSKDGTVRVWALDLDELIDVAKAGLTRGLTDDECLQYLHVDRCPPA